MFVSRGSLHQSKENLDHISSDRPIVAVEERKAQLTERKARFGYSTVVKEQYTRHSD